MKRFVNYLLVLILTIAPFNISKAANKEYIFTVKDPSFQYVGRWNDGHIGYNMNLSKFADADENTYAQWALNLPAGKEYTIYMWRVLLDKGSTDCKINVELSGDSFTEPFSNGRGMIGWVPLGTYSLPDGRCNVKLSGDSGVIIASAIKVVEGKPEDQIVPQKRSLIYYKDHVLLWNGYDLNIITDNEIVGDETVIYSDK